MSQVERSQFGYARFAGLMYLVVLAAHMAGLVLITMISGNGTFDATALLHRSSS